MRLNKRTYPAASPEKLDWLGSKHGFDATESITLSTALFSTNFASLGYVPSGVALGQITATGATKGFYGPYDNTATDGRQTLVGHLATSQILTDAGTTIGAALMTHGKVREANLPTNHGVDAAGKVDVAGSIRYI